jgi:hypothetical protein
LTHGTITWLKSQNYREALADSTYIINIKRNLSIAYRIRALAWAGLEKPNMADEDRARAAILTKLEHREISSSELAAIWNTISYTQNLTPDAGSD